MHRKHCFRKALQKQKHEPYSGMEEKNEEYLYKIGEVFFVEAKIHAISAYKRSTSFSTATTSYPTDTRAHQPLLGRTNRYSTLAFCFQISSTKKLLENCDRRGSNHRIYKANVITNKNVHGHLRMRGFGDRRDLVRMRVPFLDHRLRNTRSRARGLDRLQSIGIDCHHEFCDPTRCETVQKQAVVYTVKLDADQYTHTHVHTHIKLVVTENTTIRKSSV